MRPPNYNEADIGDKPAWLRDAPLLTDEQIRQVDENQRKQLRSLLPVLELLTGLIDVLRTHDALENTYILITSDNGWFAGEHRLGVGKQAVYEESIRVPLVVLGPEFPWERRSRIWPSTSISHRRSLRWRSDTSYLRRWPIAGATPTGGATPYGTPSGPDRIVRTD